MTAQKSDLSCQKRQLHYVTVKHDKTSHFVVYLLLMVEIGRTNNEKEKEEEGESEHGPRNVVNTSTIHCL